MEEELVNAYRATPYLGMIYALAYTGTLEVENITLDGNAPNLTLGGYSHGGTPESGGEYRKAQRGFAPLPARP